MMTKPLIWLPLIINQDQILIQLISRSVYIPYNIIKYLNRDYYILYSRLKLIIKLRCFIM